MAWANENPFPEVEGSTAFEVSGIWRGERCSTKVIGMPRVMWTMSLWSNNGHDDVRFKKDGKMSEVTEAQTEQQVEAVEVKAPQTALDTILDERRRQDAKWGEQNHDGAKWLLIATEELGEIAQSLLKADRANYVVEVKQLAAVALAWLECEHRRGVSAPVAAPSSQTLAQEGEMQIVSMERDKTKGSESPMWRCLTADGAKVNVFKHSDPAKDTFRLFDAAGYGPLMQLMKFGDVLTWKEHPVNVQMKKKGDWWEVVSVIPMFVGAKPEVGRDDAKSKAAAAAWAKALIESDDWVVLDTETTGLDRKSDEPVSIAILSSKGEVLLDTLVQPTTSIDSKASAIHGITNEMLIDKGAPLFEEIHRKLHEILGYKKLVIYNAEFDNDMLINAAHAVDVGPALYGGSWTCAMERYAEFYGEWNPHHANYKNQSLSKACEQQGITDIDAPAHSALGDCLRTLALIKKMAAYDPHPF